MNWKRENHETVKAEDLLSAIEDTFASELSEFTNTGELRLSTEIVGHEGSADDAFRAGTSPRLYICSVESRLPATSSLTISFSVPLDLHVTMGVRQSEFEVSCSSVNDAVRLVSDLSRTLRDRGYDEWNCFDGDNLLGSRVKIWLASHCDYGIWDVNWTDDSSLTLGHTAYEPYATAHSHKTQEH